MRKIIPLVLILSACGVDGVTVAPPSTSPFAGSWVLTHVSGRPLPFMQPEPPRNPNSRIRPGTQIVRGALTIRMPANGQADAVLQFCQQWTDGGVVQRDLVTETALVHVLGDSIHLGGNEIRYPDPEVARVRAGQLELSQRRDGRDFLLRKPAAGEVVGGCPA